MAPIAKENETLTTSADAPARTATPTAEAGGKTQAVALEVPVSVNGARTVEGSDKREPFSETTKTVLVFGTGAVIRLQAPVAPGQLLFLTNEKTKKEVVCQVVKSKNYRNVSGYVELEFTEPVVGFWGMRFPSDRISGQPGVGADSPAAPPSVKPAPAPAAVSKPPAPVLPKPDATANFNALKAMISSPTNVDLPAATTASVAPPPTPIASAASDPATETLKQQTARLQEQLSSMLFAERPSPGKPSETVPAKETHEAAAKILEYVKPEAPRITAPPPAVTVEETPTSTVMSAKIVPPASLGTLKSALEDEEIKIPSWLEPLARNAASASAAEEIRPKEEPKPQKEEAFLMGDLTAEPLAASAAPERETAVAPAFGASFLDPEATSAGVAPRGSRKGIVIGAVAAGILVAAAGVAWYVRNQGGIPAQTGAPSAMASNVVPAPSAGQNSPFSTPRDSSGTPQVTTPANSGSGAPIVPATITTPNSNNLTNTAAPGAGVNNAVAKIPQPAVSVQSPSQIQVQPPPKKPALGEVRLATPKLRGNGQAVSANAEEPGIALNGTTPSNSDAFGATLTTNTKQPTAPVEPLPVGGDVTPAKLLTSVSPVYPSLAKSQHVAGDVKVDALIDANGRVTTMKVVSGPTLLHQAAMDALRQWKYQPGTLDGKPVPMHLTVTLQFRLQ